MNAILQNFRRSFGPSTPFFQSLSLEPPTIMEELYRQADMYLMLDDNICATAQTVKITNQSVMGNRPFGKMPSESKKGQGRDEKQSHDQ